METADLPPPIVNHLVEFEGRLHELDVAWSRHRVAVELDGEGYHRTAAAWEAAYDRDARIRRAGWQVQRFTWRQITQQPAEIVATAHALLRGKDLLYSD
jgi:very-short-patch-repair endonuclease